MSARIFLVDVENTPRTPASGVMTEFGIVDFETHQWFHGVLHQSVPSAENPAIPALTGKGGPTFAQGTKDTPVRSVAPTPANTAKDVFLSLFDWISGFGPGRPTFVSDNPGHDFMFFAYTCDQEGFDNPFGHSSRRIGDFAAGLDRNWRNASRWKRLRKTRHDHNPVNDAMGNAEALATLLRQQGNG